MRPLAVLRPEPGNARTAARIEAAGARAIRLPLFAVTPLAWAVPDPAGYDALLLTSANAIRHGGAGLTRLTGLPVLAVGAATAAAAQAAGFAVTLTGQADAAALVAQAGGRRLLHLAGRDRVTTDGVAAVAVYAAEPLAIDAAAIRALDGSIALLHSARAARRLAVLTAAGIRGGIRIAGLSAAVIAAAGGGWAMARAVAVPRDEALVALALTLAD